MIRTWIFGITAAAGYGMLSGADTDTIKEVCEYLRQTPNSACGLEQFLHGAGSFLMAAGGTALAGNAAGSVAGAVVNKPAGWGVELLVDLLAGTYVVGSQWWADNVTYML